MKVFISAISQNKKKYGVAIDVNPNKNTDEQTLTIINAVQIIAKAETIESTETSKLVTIETTE